MANSPRKTNPIPSQARLLEILDYNPATGRLTWKQRPECPPWWNARFAGKPAFTSPTSGYLHGSIDYVVLMAHRVIWKMLHDSEPVQIDHANGDRSDNSERNLRASNASDNGRNKVRLSNNTSGHVGVSWHRLRGRWRASIKIDRTSIHLGLFDSFADALAARKAKEVELGFSARHGSLPIRDE